MRFELLHPGHVPSAPVMVLIDSNEHPFNASSLACAHDLALVDVAIDDWNNALTPWQAPGLRREDPPFGGGATQSLEALMRALTVFERQHGLAPMSHAIVGYSLGGLFALYALLNECSFVAAASVSGSLWFDDWTSYLEQLSTNVGCGRFAFLSVGTKEKRAAQPRIKLVEQRTKQTQALLRQKGFATELVVGPGSHFQFVHERLEHGITSLAEVL